MSSTRFKLLIVACALVVLAGGMLLKPRAQGTALPAPKEHSAPLLEEEAQRRAPMRAFTGLEDLGSRIAALTVAIPGVDVPAASAPVLDFASPSPGVAGPAGFGVVVSPDGEVLTHASALAGRSAVPVQIAGALANARVVAFEPATGLVLLRVDVTPAAGASPVSPEPVRAGTLGAIAGRWDGRDIVAPVFVTEVRGDAYRVTASGAVVPAGIPVFTLQGTLFALASGGEEGVAYPVHDALQRLRAQVSAGRAEPPSLGLTLQPRAGVLAKAFGDAGVIVSDVAEEGPADAAGIEPGDVLRGIGEVAIDSVDAAQRAIAGLLPGAQTEIQLVRGSAPRTLTVQVGSAFGMAGRLRRDDGAPESLTVDAVYSPAELRAAAVPPGARLLTVNGRAVASRVQALRESRRGPAVTVLRVQHQGQRFFGAFAGSR